ncbi:MAG: hypothetical protein NVS3B3_21710 [Aquirhabdus sp.]
MLPTFIDFLSVLTLAQQIDHLASGGRLDQLSPPQQDYLLSTATPQECAVWKIVDRIHREGRHILDGSQIKLLNEASTENLLASRLLYMNFSIRNP